MIFSHLRSKQAAALPAESEFRFPPSSSLEGIVCAVRIALPAVLVIAALCAPPAFATRTHRSATSGHAKSGSKKKSSAHQLHGQRQIDPDRAREIQSALIREHYLTGEPSGQWDADSQAAMTRYQSDQGWQTKITPDSRALIKLGLGPSQDAASTKAAMPPTAMGFTSPAHPPDTLSDSHSVVQ